MKENLQQFEIQSMVRALGAKRSGYYAWCTPSLRERNNEELLCEIRRVYEQHQGRYGSPRVTCQLREEGYGCSLNRVARLMRKASLCGVGSRRKRPRTTDSSHGGRVAPNLLKERTITGPNQAWVMDITYVHIVSGWVYLAAVLDLFSRKIVGWQMAEHMKASLVVEALERAVNQRAVSEGLLAHSDRGSQYASDEFQETLKKYKMTQSMSAKGNCYDNATMESFFGTLKREEVDRYEFATYTDARKAVFEYIETYYNAHRIHTGLQGLSPEKFEVLRAPVAPGAAPTAQGVSQALETPKGLTKKAGNMGSRPRPSVDHTCYPSEGCSPAEPSSVSQGETSQTEIVVENKQKNMSVAKISPSCV